MKLISKKITQSNQVPRWMIWAQSICFSLLFAIWALPETILIRNLCLIIGALISIYSIYKHKSIFGQKEISIIWILLGLFVWVTIHLLTLSNDYVVQYHEYTTIWKRAALGVIFAYGFGLNIANSKSKEQKQYWWIFYMGLLFPSIIYLIKYIFTLLDLNSIINISNFFKLTYESSSKFYIPKTSYVCFSIPVVAVSLCLLRLSPLETKTLNFKSCLFIFSILNAFFIFFNENIKNAFIYGLILILILLFSLMIKPIKIKQLTKFAIIFLVIVISFLSIKHFIKNESWQSFRSDFQIALKVDEFDHWKYSGEKGYPQGESGKIVSITNYERIAWAVVGVRLAIQNPLGYGLIEKSFGQLARIYWPDSKLHQSHSGWLDLTLGIGILGVTIILLAAGLSIYFSLITIKSIYQCYSYKNLPYIIWLESYCWIIFSILLIWCTTELSQKVFFDNLIFWIAFGGGICTINCKQAN